KKWGPCQYDPVKFTEICMKDSRALTKQDIQSMVKTIEKSGAKRILITHGTYTMPDTARYIETNLKRDDQTIIITGSMIPLEGFSPSDAGFNLGYAFSQVKILPPGVYLSMNGRVFNAGEVMKMLSEGRFDSVFNT
ncbi:TPA: asparaginase, partial [Candidatus Uhrbacteria bacterium]|nr:asparaginase [Candidatus Uhrbacteria bacterium]